MSGEQVDAFGISPQQELVWRTAQSRGGLAVPVTAEVELRGRLNVERLREAARTIVEHHEILRTDLVIPDGFVTPAQVIRPVSDEMFEADTDVDIAARWSGTPVLRTKPLAMRVARMDAEQHVMLLTASAAVLDRPGAVLLVDELAQAYAAGGACASAAAHQEPLQYADLAEWLKERVGDGRFDKPRFLHGIRDAAGALGLPFERPVGCDDGDSAGGVDPARRLIGARLELPDILPAGIDGLLAALGAEVRDLLLAAWQVVVHRYAATDQLLTGLVEGGRATPELATALGPLARLVPYHLPVTADTPFRSVVVACRAAFAAAASEAELFDPGWWSDGGVRHAVAFDHIDLGGPRTAGDVRFTPVAVHGAHPGAGLTLLADQCGATEARVAMAYDPARFAEADLAEVGAVLRTVLAHLAEDPEARVGSLRVRPGQTVAPAAGSAGIRSVHARFAEHCEHQAEAIAVKDESRSLTYRRLGRFADGLATRLRDAGIGAGSVVPVLLERGARAVGAMLGVWRAGAAFTILDDSTPPGRIAAIVADARAGVVVTSAALEGLLPQSSASRVLIDDLPDGGPDPEPSGIHADVDPAAAAYVVYTSGSTGTPKGVAVSHAALATYVHEVGRRLPGSQGTSFAAITTLAADLGYTAVFSALASGGRLSLLPKAAATNPSAMAHWMNSRAVDCLKIVPSHLKALLNSAEDPARILPRRLLVVGGEACPLDLVERVAALAPHCVVVNHYGPTETTVGVCTFAADATSIDPRAKTVPIGTPLPGTAAAVLDDEGRMVATWMPGELHIAGAQLSDGYLNQPELTAERFVSTPAAPGGDPVRWYRTGDVVRALPGGELEYLGRRDHQVKINGHRVEPREIEAVLCTHAGVRESLVAIAGPERVLTAFVAAGDTCPKTDELISHARTMLPEHMIPQDIAVLAALPRTSNGKVDRAALLAMDRSSRHAHSAVPPRDSLELQVLQIWCSMLGSDGFGVTDDFFRVGGHSLLALQLLAVVKRRLGARLPISVLFENGTVAGMADAIRAHGEWQSSVLVPMRPEGTRPPVFCVHAGGGSVMGYLDLVRAMPADVPVYGVESVGLDGTCEPLTRVEEMVDRYAAEVVRHTGAEAGDGDASRTVIGWGLGAVFACALAERLRAQGHRVGALVVVDGAAPDAEALTAVIKGASDDDYYSGMTETQIFERFAEHYELPLSAADIAGRTEEEARCIIAAAMREKTALAPDTGVEHLETLFELYRQNIAACREFVLAFDPRFCDYDVLLVRTDDSPGTEHDQALGWRRMFGDRVTQVWLPGDHYSVMKPPAVAKIAEFVDTALERVA